MNESSVRRFCGVMILFSVLIRFLDVGGYTIRAAEVPPPERRVWTLRIETDQPDEPLRAPQTEAAKPLAFSAEDAAGITVGGSSSYAVDKLALLQRKSTLSLTPGAPAVLIVHTHSSEAYTGSEGCFYEAADPYRTTDKRFSVIRVGDEIESVLQQAGISVIHDTELNDYPVYSGAYDRMLPKLEAYLAQYPTISVVLDVHRDAIENPDGTQCAFTANISGTDCAQVMLVVGTDEGGLEHPGWERNLTNALQLQAVANRLYPGLCRDMELRTERFNAHIADGAMLCEIGAAGNTLPEAIGGARLFAQALAEYLTSNQE